MKIDIHVHTKKTKQGDASTREIDAQKFQEIISATEVKILAITNHNVFDLDQYKEISDAVTDDIQLWPGVELDIVEEDRKGHLLVIVSPKYAEQFSGLLEKLSEGTTPDSFNISIDKVLEQFDSLEPLYVAHYKQKKPDLLDTDIEKIVEKTKNRSRVLKEATNALSAGIFVSHGHASIYGSDVRNWDNYQTDSLLLPDLRLPVESFEQFCLLLDKDLNAINTLMDKKYPEEIVLKPFPDKLPLILTVYNDINILFGSKGTGKSDILTAIASHYSNKGTSAKKFEAGTGKLEDIYDFAGKKLQVALKDYGIEYCSKEIDFIKKSQEIDVTKLSRYRQYFSDTLTNKKAIKIKIKDFEKQNIEGLEREFTGVRKTFDEFEKFISFVENDRPLNKYIEKTKIEALREILYEITKDLNDKRFETFVTSKSAGLFNSLVDKFNDEIARKTGTHAKPVETGFFYYALNRIKIESATKTILSNISEKIVTKPEYVGNLDEKGELYCRTEIAIQNGNIRDGDFKPIENLNKTPQTEFAGHMKSIHNEVCSQKLFEKIADLNSMEGIESIPTILELLIFKKYFTIDGEPYGPSTGETSMILLHKELTDDKDIYILDEPEKSLGNEYINNVIVPLIKEKAKQGKIVFIATHDANIAVRTLPYNSIYRYHDKNGYKTFVGNPFTNHLVNISDKSEKIVWKDISMRMLEGGKEAFGERGQIYGNT